MLVGIAVGAGGGVRIFGYIFRGYVTFQYYLIASAPLGTKIAVIHILKLSRTNRRKIAVKMLHFCILFSVI